MKKLIPFPFSLLFTVCQLGAMGQDVYSIDIPNGQHLFASQEQTFWCWAACNQMLLRAYGINESQANQSIKVFGSVINHGAGNDYSLASQGLGGTYTTTDGDVITIQPYVSYLSQGNSDDPIVIIDRLSNGVPLVMATAQHGRVCIGVDYIQNNGQYQIVNLRMLDPFTNGGVIQFSMNEFLQQGLLGFMTYYAQ